MHSPQDAVSVEGRRAPASRGDIQRCVDTALSEFTRTTRPSVTSTLATAMLGLRAVCPVTFCVHGFSGVLAHSISTLQFCLSKPSCHPVSHSRCPSLSQISQSQEGSPDPGESQCS